MGKVGPLSLALVAAVLVVTILPTTVNGCAFLATWSWDKFDVENIPRPKPVAKKRALPVAKIDLDDMDPNIQNLDMPHVRKKRMQPNQEHDAFQSSIKQQAARIKIGFHDGINRDRRGAMDDVQEVQKPVLPRAVHRDRRNFEENVQPAGETQYSNIEPKTVNRDRRDYENDVRPDPEIQIASEQVHRDRRDYESDVRQYPGIQFASEQSMRGRRTAEEEHILPKATDLSKSNIENLDRQRREEPQAVGPNVQQQSQDQHILSEYAHRKRREPVGTYGETAKRSDPWHPERNGHPNAGYSEQLERNPRASNDAFQSDQDSIFEHDDTWNLHNTGYKYPVYGFAHDREKRQSNGGTIYSSDKSGNGGGAGGGNGNGNGNGNSGGNGNNAPGNPKQRIYTCDQNKLELSCPTGKLKLINAIYGRERSDRTTCDYANTDVSSVTDHPTACYRHVETPVRNLCHNKQGCALIVTQPFLLGHSDDICPGVTKYLFVEYRCTEEEDQCPTSCGNGVCVGETCECPTGWSGDSCQDVHCEPQCQHGGQCLDPEQPCACVPGSGWQGYRCEDPICTTECVNGTCTLPNHCSCIAGYAGNACDTPVCDPPCLHGPCIAPDVCKCDEGWTGDHCEIARCSMPCENGGTCTAPESCTCLRDFAGRYCEIPTTTNKTLNIHRSQDHRGRYATIFGRCGQTNLVTIDGVMLTDFPGDCEYIFICDDILNIQVFVKREECVSPPDCYRSVRIVVTGLAHPVYLKPGHEVYYGDEWVELPGQKFGITFEINGDWIRTTIRDSSGRKMEIWYDGESTVTAELSDQYEGRVFGLVGTYDGDRTNDIVGRTGHEVHGFTPRQKAISYFNHWKADVTCPNVPLDAVGPCQGHQFTKEMRDKYITVCHELLNSQAFQPCHDRVNPAPYIYACKADYCRAILHGVDPLECICGILTKYSQDCAHADRVIDWRRPDLCPKFCRSNFEFSECGPACPATCKNIYSEESDCTGHCVDGCHCPDGKFRDGLKCVPFHECSCSRNGHSHQYAPGESYDQGCNTCYCTGGNWECTNNPCPATCSSFGEVHLTSFDGRRFDFHGRCQYVFAKDKGWNLFTVLVKTVECQTEGYTCIESATLIIGNVQDGQVITFNQGSRINVGGMSIELPYRNDLYHIRKVSDTFTQVKSVVGVKILWDGRSTLMVEVDPGYMGNTRGLCGVYNGNLGDDLLTRQGMLIDNVGEFGESWRVGGSMCPDVDTGPDIIRPCDLVTPRSGRANQLCSIIQSDVFEACHPEVDPDYFFEKCKDDTCKCETGYSCFCDAVRFYSSLCIKEGIIIEWRDSPQLGGVCSETCPYDKTYQECGSSCGRTCRELAEEDHLCGDECVQGCNCPPGKYEAPDGSCVMKRDCPCYFEGRWLPAGSQYQPFGSTRDCQCSNGEVICSSAGDEPATCPEGQIYVDCSAPEHADTQGAACQPTCESLDQELICLTTTCVSGCVCPDNLLMDGDRCSEPEDCRCLYGGRWYEKGEFVVRDCNTCYCTGGSWNCTDKQCGGICTIYGDPHYLTFDERRFKFQGDCGYVLATDHCHNQTGLFRVVAENVPCGTTGTTCAKSITITLQLLEIVLEPDKEPFTRAVAGSMIGFTSFGWRFYYIGFFTIVQVDIGLTIIWDRGTRITIKLAPHHQGKVCGMCGNFNNNPNDDFTTRNHDQVSNGLFFGNSWKVSSACPDQLKVISPCEHNPHREGWARQHCSIILNKQLFASCHSVVDPKPYYDACVYDTCACDSGGDCECFCTAVAAFAEKCSQYGFHVRWRTQEICRK
ncbi:mucin-6-like [Branchiostoma lanceolatum]|uniref:mucin-6-like n=1 Tax=Branchiostoma lanceolatum TaxID=7740 RepID=UPI0034550171